MNSIILVGKINTLLSEYHRAIRSYSFNLHAAMKYSLPRIFLLLLSPILLAVSTSYSQNLTGIWRGYFISSGADQYKFELQISHKKSSISGVSYSYLSTVFYGKATLTGNFNISSQNILIQEIKTVELKMSSGSAACIMKCSFQYIQSGKEEFLEGTFTSKYEKDTYGAKKGDNCGGGKVYLRKVQSSDFYIEPFLRKQLTARTPEKEEVVKPKTTPPPARKTTTAKTNTAATSKPKSGTATGTKKTTSPKVKTNTAKTKPVQKPDNHPVKIIEEPVAKKDPDKSPVLKKNDLPTPPVMKLRENNLVQTITVDAENVAVKIYDNGEIDDDTISVYLDKKLVLSKKRLTASPLYVNLKMDEDNEMHELVMVADNLGRIPPNTSLMIVSAGEKRYEVRITSTEQKNAVVRFIYRKPD